ncbi:MAG TPA: maleylacetoacetate isomerase [Burkholderiaceae bacterium]|nr:maleylacetoacetate isomerase [Burkholderiaceae bacterium]
MKLYNFLRGSTSHRLRIALNLKGMRSHYVPVDLRSEVHLASAFRTLNPQGLVPAQRLDDGRASTQSPAIIEWLEERYPSPALLPSDPDERAHVRALVALIGCDIHPINNRRVLEYFRKRFGADECTVGALCRTWITGGLDALEVMLQADPTRHGFCFGCSPTVADVYLVPQVESARRFGIDVGRWPAIKAVDASCQQLESFRLAAPALQTDAL